MPGGRAAFVARLQEAEIDCWLARVDDPDRSVPGRTWITEIAVVRYGQVARFGVRQKVAMFEQARDFCPAVPGIVRQVEEKPGLQWRGGRSPPSRVWSRATSRSETSSTSSAIRPAGCR
jgi:hypothetical protein